MESSSFVGYKPRPHDVFHRGRKNNIFFHRTSWNCRLDDLINFEVQHGKFRSFQSCFYMISIYGNPFVHQNPALPTMDDLPHLVTCFQVKRSWFNVLRCKGNWESHSNKSAPKSLGMWIMLWCWSRDIIVIYVLCMIYIILIWVNWRGNISREQEVNMKTQKRSLEISDGNFSLSRWFQMFTSVSQLSLPPVVSSRYGASEKSMAGWIKLFWGKGFPIANMIACGTGCSKVGFFSINVCICSTLFPLIWLRRKHQCVHHTGNFICFLFAFFSIRKHHTLASWTACCLNDPFGWKKSDQQQIIGFIGIFSINGRWSCSHESCNLKGMICLNSFWVFPSKTSKQHFRYQMIPLENAWLKMIEHQLRCETSLFVVQKISSHFTDPVGSRSGSKLKPPQFFFSQKEMVRIVWTVQSPRYLTFPSFLRFTLWKVGREDLISIPGMAWSMNTSQPGKRQKNERIFRGLERKLVVDTLSQWNGTTWLLILIG